MIDTLRDYLSNEFVSCVEGMRNRNHTLHERMYYMSASFGALRRVLNIEYNKKLVFAHMVLQTTHQSIMQAIAQNPPGSGRAIKIEPIIIEKLADHIEDLGEQLVENSLISESLENISEISYIMTGNGHYLYRKEVITILNPRKMDSLEEQITDDSIEPIE